MQMKQWLKRAASLLLAAVMILGVLPASVLAEETAEREGNQNYYSNQGELVDDAFTMLPLGAVQPEEWLREQLLLQKEGLLGNMQDNYPIYSDSNGWRGGSGDTWEKGPYYFRGLMQTAFILNDEDLKAKAMEWIDWTLDNQRKNGFMGPLQDGEGDNKTWDWWPRMVVLLTLQDYYEATEYYGDPDKRVLPFLENYFRYQLEHIDEWPLNQYWDQARGGDNIEVVLWLYNRLYDDSNPGATDWLITLANKLYQSTYKWTDIYQGSTTREHVVNTTQGLKTPAVMYQVTGNDKDKTAMRAGIENYSIDHGRVDGLPNSDEAARENYPYRGTELCGVSESILSQSITMRILGEGWIGDNLESLAYNSLPAAYSPDLRNHTYFQAQNQVVLAHGTHDFDQDHGDSIAFGAFSGFECCFPNGHMGWPKFVQSMWMATRDNGLAIVAYGPNTVTAKVADGKTAVFTQSTNYPFEETVTLTYSGDTAAFPLKLRIPEWCEDWTIALNDQAVTGEVVNGYLTLNHTFQKGDTIELVFPMQVELSTWYNNALSVKYGPLIFGVKVKEDWRETTDYSIFWDSREVQEVDPFTFKETYPASDWNYALVIDENDIQGSFKVVRTEEVAAQPFNVSTAPITLKVTGQLVPDWKLMGNSVPEAPYSPLEADALLQREIELIPTGCTRMHINQIPWVGEAEDTVVRTADTADTYTYDGVKTVQFDNVIVPDADSYQMVITYSGSGSLDFNLNTKYDATLSFLAGGSTVTVDNLQSLVTDSAFRFCYEHYNRVRFTGNDAVTIEKIEIIPIGTFKEPKVTSSSATMDSIKLTTNIDRADGFYTVYYGTKSGNYTMTSQGHHERIAYLTGLEPDTTYYGKVEMRVNGVLTQTEEFTVKTLAEESDITDPWSVPGAFTDDFSDATASKDRWVVLGDSVVTYSGGQMNIGDSLNVKAVTGSENWQNYTVEATLNPGESGRDCGVMIRTTNATASGPDAYNGYYIGVKKGAVIVGYADGGWHQMGSEIPANIEKNKPCNLKVVAVGDQFAIFVDDVQVGGIITPPVAYASGQVGLRSYNNPFTCDTFTVRAVTNDEKALFGDTFVGFTDDFDDMDADPWTALGDTDAVRFDGGKMNVGSSSNIKVVAGKESWTDYTVEATFTCGDSSNDKNCGLMFRTKGATGNNADSYQGYYVGLGAFGWNRGIVVGYGNNGWNFLETIPYDYTADTPYTLKVVVVGNQFAVYVNDEFQKIFTSDLFTQGQVGVRSYQFPFTCDDFTVREVTEAEKQVFETGFVGFTDDFSDTAAGVWTALGEGDVVTYDGESMNVDSSSNIKVVAGEESWTDYTVEGTFTCGDAVYDQNCGLMFRTTNATAQNADSYQGYYVGLGVFGGIRGVVVGYGNNSWNWLKTIPFDYRADVAYRLRVAVVGDSFAIYVDDVLMGVITDNRYAAGQVGVRSYKFPFTCDDFSVRAVNEAELADINRATSILETDGTTSFHEGAQIKFATLTGNYTYKIQYGTAPGVYTHEYVGLTSKHNPDKLAISGLEDGTTYYLRVVAMSGGEEVAWSEEVTVAPGETDNPQDEIANLQSLLTQAEAVAEKSDVLEDRIAYAREVLGMSNVNRMDLTTAQAILQSAMNQNEHDLGEEEAPAEPTVEKVTVSPAAASVQQGGTQQFTASVTGENSPAQTVTWTVRGGKEGTTITTDGLLTVAADETATTLTVVATSTQDQSKSGEATVTVTEIPVTTYTLTVEGGSGSGSYEAGAQVTITANAPETGMRFKAWEAEGITLTDPTANPLTITMPEGDVTLTATYEKIPETVTTHTVTLNANGGTVTPSTLTVEDGETTVLPTPYRAGSYRFLGWFDASGKQYTAFTPITEDVTLTARWQYTGGSHGDPVEPSKPAEEPEEQPEQPATSYSDVKPADWYAEAVAYVSENGLMDGVGNGRFNPDGAVTRAMVWTVLARMAGEDTNGGATWYSKAQAWAMRTGVSDGTNPTASITREQLAAMLYRYAGSPVVSGNLSAYPDANKVSDWAVDAMVWATEEGIINGMNGYLKPQDGATRAQLAAMLMRFVEEQ